MSKKIMTQKLVKPGQLLSGTSLFQQLFRKRNNSLIPVKLPKVNVTTLAGDTHADVGEGTGIYAMFSLPTGIATDFLRNVYVADCNSNRIYKIGPSGIVSTLAGSGSAGFVDGTGAGAWFNFPTDIAADASGNIYVADTYNHRIRKITPAGVVSTLAGDGTPGFAEGVGAVARFYYPTGVTADTHGNIYVADQENHRIRKITPAGVVSTLAGSGAPGFAEGAATAAQFKYPIRVATDVYGNVYVVDCQNHRIRKIRPTGVVTTLAGNGIAGFANGTGSTSQFNFPTGIATDASGNVYVADTINNLIRRITVTGAVSTVAGSGFQGFANGRGTIAEFNYPYGISVDASGTIYVVETGNNCVRKIK